MYALDESKPLVHVEEILRRHWAVYGRNYYCRYDYEGVATESKNAVMQVGPVALLLLVTNLLSLTSSFLTSLYLSNSYKPN